jgi:hypothetical protein
MMTKLTGLVIAITLPIVLAQPAHASNQTITVVPATGLHAQQLVHLTAAGFKPGALLVVTECADKGAATGPDDCDLPHEHLVHANQAGEVEDSYRVSPGVFAPNHIDCTRMNCVLAVSALSFDPNEQASASISFAPGVHTTTAGTGASDVTNSTGTSADWIFPLLAAAAWLFCAAIRRPLRKAPGLIAAGFMALGVFSIQAYALATARLVPSGVTSATVYAAYFIGLDAVVLAYLGTRQLLASHSSRVWLSRVHSVFAILSCLGVLWVLVIAIFTMAQSSVSDGGGPIWYASAGVCTLGAIAVVVSRRSH